MLDILFVQVEEAVAVLQAHQAKKDATQKVSGMATATAAAATSWTLPAVFNWYDCNHTDDTYWLSEVLLY